MKGTCCPLPPLSKGREGAAPSSPPCSGVPVDIEGVNVGGLNINDKRYADDTVLIADTADKLQRLVDKSDVECNRVGLKINIDRTEVVAVAKR